MSRRHPPGPRASNVCWDTGLAFSYRARREEKDKLVLCSLLLTFWGKMVFIFPETSSIYANCAIYTWMAQELTKTLDIILVFIFSLFNFSLIFLWQCCEPTTLLIAASMDALGIFLFLHCSSMCAKFIFRSGFDPPSADETKFQSRYSPQVDAPIVEMTRKHSGLTFHSYFYHHAKLHKHPSPGLVFGSFNVFHL